MKWIKARLATCLLTVALFWTWKVLAAQEPIGERVARVETQQSASNGQLQLLMVQVNEISREQSMLRGMGTGAFALLGVLDTIQLLLIRRGKAAQH